MRLRYYVSYGGGPNIIDQVQQMHQFMHQMIGHAAPGAGGTWRPSADVYECEDSVVVRVELAGVKEDDIDVTLFADRLAVSGERRNEVPAGTAAYHLAGILYGKFRLEVPVVVDVEREEVEASFENGLLTVILPKATSPQPSAISITPSASAHGPWLAGRLADSPAPSADSLKE